MADGPLTRLDDINQADGFGVYSARNQGWYYVPYDVVFEAFTDSLTSDTTSNAGPATINNLAIMASVSASTLIVNVVQNDGISAPTASSNTFLSFADPAIDSSKNNLRTISATITTTIPTGATFGMANGVADHLYVYLLDNFGTSQELAFAAEDSYDERLLWSTTALSAASTSRNVLYSTTARSNVPIRFIGKISLTEATAGTYLTAPTRVQGANADRSGVIVAAGLAVALATTVTSNVASISVPPGTWEISGALSFKPAATTSMTVLGFSISQTSATMSGATAFDQPSQFTGQIVQSLLTSPAPMVTGNTNPMGQAIPSYRFKTDTAVTLFLVANATFTIAALTATGWIQARRAKS